MVDGRDPTRRFSDRVRDYARHRPGYPAALLDALLEDAAPGAGARVADVGSGTGILTAALLDRGYRVAAVEPNDAMRGAAEERLGGRAGFESVAGTAEATGLADGSVALVTAAQAFHWFDRAAARREFRRILREGGRVACLWNRRRLGPEPFLQAYESLLRHFGTDYERVDHTRTVGPTELLELFGEGGYVEARVPNVQELDREGLRGRLLSASYLPGPGERGHDAMLALADRIFERHADGGVVRLEYDCEAYWGRPGA